MGESHDDANSAPKFQTAPLITNAHELSQAGSSAGKGCLRMKRRIPITGASGFVGQYMASLLIERGFRVSALQRGSFGIELPPLVEPIYADL